MMKLELVILGREESARCQFSKKRTECFHVQIPRGTPAVLISAEALMQEIRKAGLQSAGDLDTSDGFGTHSVTESKGSSSSSSQAANKAATRGDTKTA